MFEWLLNQPVFLYPLWHARLNDLSTCLVGFWVEKVIIWGVCHGEGKALESWEIRRA